MYRHVIWDFDGTLIVFGHGVGLEGHRGREMFFLPSQHHFKLYSNITSSM